MLYRVIASNKTWQFCLSSHLRAGAEEASLPLHQPASRERPDFEVLVAGGQELVGVEAEA